KKRGTAAFWRQATIKKGPYPFFRCATVQAPSGISEHTHVTPSPSIRSGSTGTPARRPLTGAVVSLVHAAAHGSELQPHRGRVVQAQRGRRLRPRGQSSAGDDRPRDR